MVLGQFYSNNPSTISPPFLNVSVLYFSFVDSLYPLHSCNSKLSNFNTQAQSLHQFEFPFTQTPSKTIQLPPKDPCGFRKQGWRSSKNTRLSPVRIKGSADIIYVGWIRDWFSPPLRFSPFPHRKLIPRNSNATRNARTLSYHFLTESSLVSCEQTNYKNNNNNNNNNKNIRTKNKLEFEPGYFLSHQVHAPFFSYVQAALENVL